MSSSCPARGHGEIQSSHACPACGAWSMAELAGAAWEGISSSVQIGVRRRKIRRSTAVALLAGFFTAGAVIGWAARPDAGGGGNPVQEKGQPVGTPLVPPFARGDEGGSGEDVAAERPSENPAYRGKETSDDDSLFAAKLKVKIERIIVEGAASARTYKVPDGNYTLYRTTIRSSRRHRIALSPTIARAVADLGPYFVIVDDEEYHDLFVIPGKILSPERIETFPILASGSTRRAYIATGGGSSPILRGGDWSLDLTPYKNALHLLQ